MGGRRWGGRGKELLSNPRSLRNTGGASGLCTGGVVARVAGGTAGVEAGGGAAVVATFVAAFAAAAGIAGVASADLAFLQVLRRSRGGGTAGGGGNDDCVLGLEPLRQPGRVERGGSAPDHRNQQGRAQLAPKARCEVLEGLTVVTGTLEEEAEAVLLDQPLLQLDSTDSQFNK